MTTYQQENKAYEIDDRDEDDEIILGKVVGFTVFSTIKIGDRTLVRAVVENKTARAARFDARVWFIEWKVTFGVGNATRKLADRMTRSEALKEGERFAGMIAGQPFVSTDEFETFYDEYMLARKASK